MSINKEDNLSLEDVINLCQKIDKKNIDVLLDPLIRPKTVNFLAKYKISIDYMKEIIKSISKEDYCKGPVSDSNPKYKHPFWIFIKYLGDIKINVYIKIKIINHHRKIIVFSFHEEGVYNV